MFLIKQEVRYQILSLPFSLLEANDFDVELDETALSAFYIEHGNSLFDDQLRRRAGAEFIEISPGLIRVPHVILVEAKKNPRKEEQIETLIRYGFSLNGKHFKRYGKSASQGKAGITLFVRDDVFDYLIEASTLGLPPDECVISKYEAQRCLTLSVCTLIYAPLPRVIIIDEYTKIMPKQYIRYVDQERRSFTDKETGEEKTYNARVVKEGLHDVKLSPFDGCGCHTHEMSELWTSFIGLDYTAIGYQIRLPFFKGYSVEVPFREWFHEQGISQIRDVFGNWHDIDEVDCIWNTSMWKGAGLFKDFGADAWNEYVRRLNHYGYVLGVSKYSHHKKDLNLKARFNFQYLQCLDLQNPEYQKACEDRMNTPKYDILDQRNWGNMLKLASYTTDLFERIISGDKFYTLKFLGIDDTLESDANSRYVEAALINDQMLKDPCLQKYLYRKLKSKINQAKLGKIYADGFYHTVVGDMIGYLEYAAGREPSGCLGPWEFFCKTLPQGKILSLRSPLVCPSEVNDVTIVSNSTLEKWFSHFQDQDVVMIGMYDLSMPRQGGMDADGDAVFLCNDPLLVNTKIDKPIIIDVEDKVAAKKKPYNIDNLVAYEMATRDSRIGELTNIATSIINQNPNGAYQKINSDNVSLLRIYQGKEIDYLKTGVRWQVNKGLRRFLKKLPYFLLYNYPEKLETYQKLRKKNESLARDERYSLNAYRSASPMNELCDYVETWEKKKFLWAKPDLDTRCLIVDPNAPTLEAQKRRQLKNELRLLSRTLHNVIAQNRDRDREDYKSEIDGAYETSLKNMIEIEDDRTILANNVIDLAYSQINGAQAIVWHLFGDIIIENLKKNSPLSRRTRIIETPYQDNNSYEFLGKYYKMLEGGE